MNDDGNDCGGGCDDDYVDDVDTHDHQASLMIVSLCSSLYQPHYQRCFPVDS